MSQSDTALNSVGIGWELRVWTLGSTPSFTSCVTVAKFLTSLCICKVGINCTHTYLYICKMGTIVPIPQRLLGRFREAALIKDVS